jgi:hypothetical protein
MSDRREPPREIELAEMLEAADEVDDPVVFRILDIQIQKQRAKQDAERKALPTTEPAA